MATNLTDIFGDEINVGGGAYETERQYAGCAGADGLMSMNLGGRGQPVVIHGTIRVTAASYAAGRAAAAAELKALQDTHYLDIDDYTFNGETFYQVVWEKVEPLPDNSGRLYHFTSAGEMTVKFIAYGRSLI